MKKIPPFIIIFLIAYFLAKILTSVFGFAGFDLAAPRLAALFLDLLFWAGAWAVSYIVYDTVREALVTGRHRKKEREEGGKLHEIS